MIIDRLLQKFPDMQALRVRDIKVDKIAKKVTCTVSYPDFDRVDKPTQNAIREAVAATIPTGYRYEIMLVNDKFNPVSLRASVLDVLKKRYPLFANLKPDNVSVEVSDEGFSVLFRVSPTVKRNMEADGFLDELTRFFADYTSFAVQFAVCVDPDFQPASNLKEQQERLVQLAINKEMLKPRRYFDVADLEKYIGKEVLTKPMYICDVRKPMDTCVVCGRISGKTIRDVKSNPNLKICKFSLTDDSGATMPCVTFIRLQTQDFEILRRESDKPDSEVHTLSKKRAVANENKLKKYMFLANGLEVVARGKAVYSNFSESLELQVYDISKCRIMPISTQPTFERGVPDQYVLIQPVPVRRYRQMDFTQTQKSVDSVLSGKTYAVLYANTTGFSVTKDKVYSLCAVKITGGHASEKFFTNVEPELPLTQQQLAAAKVDVRDLALCPTLTEIIPDLYKFLHGATLIGADLPPLLALFNYYGAPLGFNFNNEIANQNEILSQLFDHSDFAQKPNCAKLEDVARVCKVSYKTSNASVEIASAVAECIDVLSERAK
ncbi:MAG: hypothetical protein NC132_04915 [Corallococcus sp.]|nr:hypothetical protein [Corallococcus sp.]MCM1359729.1 hypothetical protein [Corallococcus sp.]MCM1395438.1 hypothetical protein [Corallococcus sp.]